MLSACLRTWRPCRTTWRRCARSSSRRRPSSRPKTALVDTLQLQLARLRRQQFGRSSERLDRDIDQLELVLEDLKAEQAATAPAHNGDKGQAPPTTARPARRPLPDHLPRDVVEHPAPTSCPACGGSLRPLGEDVTEILDWVSGRFRVVRHVRP